MGLKPLGLQMIPWCFHVAAGATRHSSSSSSSSWFTSHDDDEATADSPKPSVRLVGPDGHIKLYHCRVSAAEVMASHPLHLLCRSDAFVIGQPIPALSPDDRLLPGHTYFLLPSHFFHSALSFASLASCFGGFKQRGGGGGCGAPLPRLIEIQKTAAGRLQVRVSEEYLDCLWRSASEEEAMDRRGRRVCTTEELAKDYKQLVSCRSWKPKLETINEAERRRRSGGAPFGGIGRRKKRAHRKNNHDNKEDTG